MSIHKHKHKACDTHEPCNINYPGMQPPLKCRQFLCKVSTLKQPST